MESKRPNLDTSAESIGSKLKGAFPYIAGTQAITSYIGVIIAYNNKDMPMEVVVAYTGLIGIAINMALLIGVQLLKKIGVEA